MDSTTPRACIGDCPKYVGMDIHKQYSYLAIMNREGELIDELRIENDREELEKISEGLKGSKIAIEATSNWMYIYEIMEKNSDVKLVNPGKTKAIASAKVKNDRLDAKMLAHLLRANLIAESHIPSKLIRDLRSLVRYRKALIEDRTRVKNRIHAVLTRNGIRSKYSDLFGKSGREFLESLQLDGNDARIVESNLRMLDSINEEIDQVDCDVMEMASRDEDVSLLITMPGIGIYSAMLIKAEIADISRFPHHTNLVGYAGLNPSIKASGDSIYHGRITKQGSKWLRWILVQCANVAIRNDSYLRNFYERIKARKGHNVAIVATARKMLVCVYYMLTRRDTYDPYR